MSGLFAINYKYFLYQMTIFLSLFLLLRIFLFKPLSKIFEKRDLVMDEMKKKTLSIEETLKERQTYYNAVISKAKNEAYSMKEDVIVTGRKAVDEILKQAKIGAKTKLDEMNKDFDLELKINEKNIKKQTESIAQLITKKVYDKEINI